MFFPAVCKLASQRMYEASKKCNEPIAVGACWWVVCYGIALADWRTEATQCGCVLEEEVCRR